MFVRFFSTMRLTVFILLFILVSACNLNFNREHMVEGIMTYKITYLQDESENPLISLMPPTLEMTFKNNAVKMEVEGWMGVFKSTFIKPGASDEAINMLKMMGKRYYYVSDTEDGFMGMTSYHNLNLQFTGKTKQILNYKCKHAMASVPDTDIRFDVYYTDKIAIKNPNQYTPFAAISGVLMEFSMEINGIKMLLQAKDIKGCEIPDDVFLVPKNYQKVEKTTIDEIFQSLV